MQRDFSSVSDGTVTITYDLTEKIMSINQRLKSSSIVETGALRPFWESNNNYSIYCPNVSEWYYLYIFLWVFD